MNGIYNIDKIVSIRPTSQHVCLAMLLDLGCKVGSMSKSSEGDKDYGLGWQALVLSEVTDMDNLPEIWQTLLKALNSECWRINYTIVHCPEPILCSNPDVPVAGFFVTEKKPGKIQANNMIHTNGQFIEYDNHNKNIWEEWI